MTQNGLTTDMLHFACGQCEMAATVVDTESAHLAWLDHMASHPRADDFQVYSWTVVRLFQPPE